MNVNQVIFGELMKSGYSIRGKNKIWNLSDPKILYITPQLADGFLKLSLNLGLFWQYVSLILRQRV